MHQDMNKIKAQIKDNINILVGNGNLQEAKALINEYRRMVSDDIEIYSMDAVIAIIEEDLEYAEEVLKQGLNLYKNDFDINYNLGYLYQIRGDIDQSLNFYRNAYNYAENITVKEEIKSSVKDIIIKKGLDINIEDFINKSIKKRCLVLCHFFSVYVKNFLEKLKKDYDIEFDLLTIDKNYEENIEKGIINNIFLYKTIDELMEKLNLIEKYDVIHIHFLSPFYGPFASDIRKKCNKLIVTIWGSDYYRTTEADKLLQKNIFKIADNINFGNENTLNNFNDYYNKVYSSKLSICRFGLIQLDYIKSFINDDKIKLKESLGLPKDSIIITCGYNASTAQNHLNIIDSILKVKNQLPDKCYFLFPMTYGDSNLVVSVREKLMKSRINYRIYDKFLSEEDTAKLRVVSDVMIQVQTTDQLSGSMQEYLYAGNLIITGSWLPYSVFKNNGIYFIEVDKVEEVGKKLMYSVRNLHKLKNKCNKNKDIIWNMTSWEKAINNWIDVYKK